jgi:hypothetical protein
MPPEWFRPATYRDANSAIQNSYNDFGSLMMLLWNCNGPRELKRNCRIAMMAIMVVAGSPEAAGKTTRSSAQPALNHVPNSRDRRHASGRTGTAGTPSTLHDPVANERSAQRRGWRPRRHRRVVVIDDGCRHSGRSVQGQDLGLRAAEGYDDLCQCRLMPDRVMVSGDVAMADKSSDPAIPANIRDAFDQAVNEPWLGTGTARSPP